MQLDPVTHQMTAIVLAGDRTKADSLINHTAAGSKAMIDLDGTPMVRRVLNSLRAARVVGNIRLAGPEASEVATDAELKAWIDNGEIYWSEPGISPSTSAYNAMLGLDAEDSVLLTTADHPLLTPEIVDAFGRQSLVDDVDVTVGLAPYPLIAETFWRRIEQERKKPLVVIGLLGWSAVIRYRLGLLSLEEALAKLSKRLGLRIRAVILPYANAAIDVDSIADLMLVKGALEKAAAEDA